MLWGEYAVLDGAEAGVMAVDRYAECTFTPSPDHQWHLHSGGLAAAPERIRAHWLNGRPPPVGAATRLFWFAAKRVGLDLANAPQSVFMDTSGFYQNGEKFGLGSSAALCTALYSGAQILSGRPADAEPNLAEIIAVHRASQDNQGSGIDVAASVHGGLQSFVRQDDGGCERATVDWPADLHWRAIYSGQSASTPAHLGRFDEWRRSGADTATLTALKAACQPCAQGLSLSTLADYIECLRAFDQASGVGIYSEGHANLHKLASRVGVVYKPCGAGGGDLGIALSHHPQDLDEFARRATAQGFVETQLELAKHGVNATRGHHLPDP